MWLINPPKRIHLETVKTGKKRARRKSGRKGGLPSGLLSRSIKRWGPKLGMKKAWAEYRSGARTNWPKLPTSYHRKKAKHRPVYYSGIRKGGGLVKAPYARLNPLGAEVMLVGNPRKRKYTKRRKNVVHQKRKYHRNPLEMLLANKGRKRSYRRKNDPARPRRNAPRSYALAISPSRPLTLVRPILAGTGGYFAADYIPAMIGMAASPLTRIGIKAGVVFAGGMVAGKMFGKAAGLFAAVGAGLNLTNDVLRTYVFKTSTTAGMGAFVRPQIGMRRPMAGMGAQSSPYVVGEKAFPA